MASTANDDDLTPEARDKFRQLVASVGVKQFARSLDISPRQVNRMRSGAQPNPVDRLVRCLQAAEPEVGDAVLDFICQEMGGRFSRSTEDPADVTDTKTHGGDRDANTSEPTPTDGQLDQLRAAIHELRRHIINEAGTDATRRSRIVFD